MKNEILKFCLEKGLLVDKDILDLFSESSDIESVKLIIEKIQTQTNQKIITRTLINENKDKVDKVLLGFEQGEKILEKLNIKLGLSIEISKEVSKEVKKGIQKEISGNVKV